MPLYTNFVLSFLIVMKNYGILLIMLTFAMATPSEGQFYSAGIQVSSLNRSPMIKNMGVHATLDCDLASRFGIELGLGYYFPHQYSSPIELPSKSGSGSVTVNSGNKISAIQFTMLAKFYLLNQYSKNNFGLYLLGGVGIIGLTNEAKLGPYDEGQYGRYSRSQYEHRKTTDATYSIGLGFETQGDIGVFYFEPVFNLAAHANVDDGTKVYVRMPNTFQFNLGYRVYLSKP